MRAILFLLMTAVPAMAQITAAPMQSQGAQIAYPRLTQFPDGGVKTRVNAALAKQEKDDRATRKDCLDQLRQSGEKPTADSYHADIHVAYLSARYLSVEVHSGYYCGGPYPTNDAPAPLSFDLKTGSALAWDALFKPGFITAPDGKKSGLWTLYQAHYGKTGQDKDCKDAVKEADGTGLHLWLDGKRGGLVAQPDFPHVIEACAEQIVFRPSDLRAFAGPELLADLAATR